MNSVPPAVFISYTHADEAWKDRLVSQLRVLEAAGRIDVWDDRRIDAGDDWKERIEESIDGSRAAILLISADFLNSRFILEEEVPRILERRARDGLLTVPLIVKPCPWDAIPWLRELQARPTDGVPLSSGTEHWIDQQLSKIASEIADLVQGRPSRHPQVETRRLRSSRWARLLHIALPTVVTFSLLILAAVWRLPTRVMVELVVGRTSFAVGGDTPQEILSVSAGFSALVIERCGTVSLLVERLEVLDPAGNGRGGQVSPWRELAPGAAAFACTDTDSKVTLRSPDPFGPSIGTFDRLRAEPGTEVALAVADGDPAEITLSFGNPLQFDLPLHTDSVEIVTTFVELGTAKALDGDLVTYRAWPDAADRYVHVETDAPAVLVMAPARDDPDSDLFAATPAQRIEVTSIEFVAETLAGELKTAVLEGVVSYADYANVSAVRLAPGDFLTIAGRAGFGITKLAISNTVASGGKTGLEMTLEGIVAQARSGPPGSSQDLRVTVGRHLWDGWPGRTVLTSLLLIWGFSTLWLIRNDHRRLVP